MNPAPGAPPIAQIIITCDAALKVAYEYQSNVPPADRRAIALLMCEKAKLDLNDNLMRQEAEAAAQLIEPPPPGFDPGKVRLVV